MKTHYFWMVTCVGIFSFALAGCRTAEPADVNATEAIRLMVLKDCITAEASSVAWRKIISVYFVNTESRREAAALSAWFKIPGLTLITDTNRVGQTDEGVVIDKLTGARANHFGVQIEWVKAGVASVIAGWSTSPTGGACYRYALVFRRGAWRIGAKRLLTMSRNQATESQGWASAVEPRFVEVVSVGGQSDRLMAERLGAGRTAAVPARP